MDSKTLTFRRSTDASHVVNRVIPYWRLFCCLIFLLCFNLQSKAVGDIIINEITANGKVELKNVSASTIDISSYWLCNFPAYQQISNLTVDCGSTNLAAGAIVVIDGFSPVSNTDGELGLYTSSAFGSSTAIEDYVEWGSSGHQRASVAIAAGVWTTSNFVPAFSMGQSIEFDGSGNMASDWSVTGTPTPCVDYNCMADGGTISTTDPTIICVDGVADPINVTVSGASGTNGGWIVTDDNNNILSTTLSSPFNLDGAGAGVCRIWYIRYEAGLSGMMNGNNLSQLAGCFDLSNFIEVI